MAKIMLVEDDNNLREIYGARLLAEGHEIVTAKDGEEALATAVKEKPDLIISDVMMPRISGFDMLDILRNAPETKLTKVIMMTALSQAEDKARADNLGADRYLVKSQVTLEDMAQVVKDVLEGKPESESDKAMGPQQPEQAEAPPTQTPNNVGQATPEPTPVTPPAAAEPTTEPTPTDSQTAQQPPKPEPPTATTQPTQGTPQNPQPATQTGIPASPGPQQATSSPGPLTTPTDQTTQSSQAQSQATPQDDNSITTSQPPTEPPKVDAAPVASQPPAAEQPTTTTPPTSPTEPTKINVELPKAQEEQPTNNNSAPAQQDPPQDPSTVKQPDLPGDSKDSNVGPNLTEALQAEGQQTPDTPQESPQEPVKDLANNVSASSTPPAGNETEAQPSTAPELPKANTSDTQTTQGSTPPAETTPAIDKPSEEKPSDQNPLSADTNKKKVVIEPINDIKKGPDLEALAKKDEESAATLEAAKRASAQASAEVQAQQQTTNTAAPQSPETPTTAPGQPSLSQKPAGQNEHDQIAL